MRHSALATAISAALLAGPAAVYAQSDDGLQSIEEVVVTARKREETLQDVPFSIVAQTSQAIRNTGAENLEDIATNVAGFTVQNLGPGQSQVAIRGVSAGQIVRDQPGVKEQVGVYMDESVISLSLFTPDLDLYDLNRVEVLRGPQGTLFGSGSLSGTVRYITNQPLIGEREFQAELSGNIIDDGGSGGYVKGLVNVPISDTAALRAVGYYRKMGGFIDAVQPTGVNEDVNEGEQWGVRLAMRFEPNDRLTITPRLIYQEIDIEGFNREDEFNILANPFTTTRPPVTLGDREQFTQLEETFTDDFMLADLDIEYDFGTTVLTSITSFTDRDVLQVRDATQLTASITAQPNILNLPESIYTLDAPLDDATDVQMFTQELRLASNTDSDLQWVAGFFYSDIERQYGQSLDVAGFEAATGIPTAGPRAGTDILFFSDIPYDFQQYAFFGEGTYSFNDQFDLTFGLRYFDFEEDRVLNFDGIFADTTIGEAGTTSSDGVSPRIMASYVVNDSVTLNGQISEGFRLGGINDPLNEPLCSPEDLATFGGRDSFGDEELTNYEVGAKTTFWEGRGSFNIALFHMDIDDLQATLTAGTCSSRVIFNVPEAFSQGIEMEFAGQPTENFDFAISTSLISAELDSTVTSTDAAGNVSVIGGLKEGNRLPTVPEFQFSAAGNYRWPMDNGWEGFVTGVYQHVGDRFTQFGDQDPNFGSVPLQVTPIGNPSVDFFTFDPELPSYDIINLRGGVRTQEWEFSLFINNVTDERAFLALDQERGGRARIGFLTNEPRTYGVTARFFF